MEIILIHIRKWFVSTFLILIIFLNLLKLLLNPLSIIISFLKVYLIIFRTEYPLQYFCMIMAGFISTLLSWVFCYYFSMISKKFCWWFLFKKILKYINFVRGIGDVYLCWSLIFFIALLFIDIFGFLLNGIEFLAQGL